MTDTTRYQRRENLVATELDGELVMMCLDSGAYFGLNEVASAIWQQLEQPVSLDDICAQLLLAYEIDADGCHREVSRFIATLHDQGLIRPCH